MRPLHPALCLFAVALGSCGGGDAPPARTVQAEAGKPVQVIGKEYYFDPAGLVLEGGGSLQITLDNRGSLAHNIKVLDDGREIGGTTSFPGGEQRSATVNVRPGKYRLVCTVGDHEEKGMLGTLEVR